MSTKLSNTEWEVMEVLWRSAPLSVTEVFDLVPDGQASSAKTVRTLLDRMIKKKAVRREKVHGMWVYHPAVAREACLQQESRSFIERFFSARPEPLVAHLVENDMLTDEELERLQKMIAAHRKANEGDNDHE